MICYSNIFFIQTHMYFWARDMTVIFSNNTKKLFHIKIQPVSLNILITQDLRKIIRIYFLLNI